MSRHHYGPHRDQRGTLTLPRGTGPFPVAVLVHGGSWRARYGAVVMRPLARDLRRRGWATWNLEYRRVGRGSGGGWPQTGDDVVAGIDLLAELGPRLDLNNVVVIGHSAGGQLGLIAAGRRSAAQGPVRVRAVVGQAPPTDLARSAQHGAPSIVAFMGGDPSAEPERYREASPIEQLPLGLSQLLVHGDGDRVVSLQGVTRYYERAAAAGDDVTLEVIPGARHIAHLNPRGVPWAAVTEWLAVGNQASGMSRSGTSVPRTVGS